MKSSVSAARSRDAHLGTPVVFSFLVEYWLEYVELVMYSIPVLKTGHRES